MHTLDMKLYSVAGHFVKTYELQWGNDPTIYDSKWSVINAAMYQIDEQYPELAGNFVLVIDQIPHGRNIFDIVITPDMWSLYNH